MVINLMQQMLGIWIPTECKIYCRVLVAGEYVMLTATQARRYEELMRTNKS